MTPSSHPIHQAQHNHMKAVRARLMGKLARQPQPKPRLRYIAPPKASLPRKPLRRTPSEQSVFKKVAADHGVTVAGLFSTSRVPKSKNARYDLYFRLRSELFLDLYHIGNLCGVNATTISHGSLKHIKDNGIGPASDWFRRILGGAQ